MIWHSVKNLGDPAPKMTPSPLPLLSLLMQFGLLLILFLLFYVGFHYAVAYSNKIGRVWPIPVFMVLVATVIVIYWNWNKISEFIGLTTYTKFEWLATERLNADYALEKLQKEEKWKEMIDTASNGIREFPDHIYFYYSMSIAQRKLNDLEASYKTAKQGIFFMKVMYQDSLGLWNWFITICSLTRRHEEAIDIWMKYRDQVVKPNGKKTALLDNNSGKLNWENAMLNVVGSFTLLKKFDDGIRETEKYLSSVDGSETGGTVFFNAAGLFSLAGNSEKALFYMEKAILSGKDRENFKRDSDFDPMRELPEFKALLEK